MTVKDLKELLEILIMEGKENYTVLIIDSEDGWLMHVNDKEKEVYL